MKSIKMYWHPNCSTCKKAIKFLNAHNLNPELHDLREKAPSKAAIKKMMHNYPDQEKKIFNTSGLAYRENNFKDKIHSMSKSDMVDALANNGLLLKRPFILLEDDRGVVGFQEKEWNALFNIA